MRNENIRNIPGVLKMIQDCPIRKKKAEDHKRRKGKNSNGNHNTSNINIKVMQAAIAESHTYQPNDNRIPVQVQIPSIVIKRGVNSVSTNNDVSVTVLGI